MATFACRGRRAHVRPRRPGKMATMTTEVARPAATIVLVRGATPDPGIEVLVLRRSRSSRFVPGFVVFPGGAIDTGDADLAERWFWTREERARACALRQLREETGLRLTATGVADGSPSDPAQPPPPRAA